MLCELGIDGLPVDPEAIAGKHDILVQPKPDAKPGVSGMLVKAGDGFGIMYATHIPSRGFQRFSIAHELGHYIPDKQTLIDEIAAWSTTAISTTPNPTGTSPPKTPALSSTFLMKFIAPPSRKKI